MSEILPFEPQRFQTIAPTYRAARAPYPPGLIRRVAAAIPLSGADRVLDLGCGPGQLAIGFAFFAGAVLGLDPAEEMVAVARDAALGLAPNARFAMGSSYDLGPEIGSFRLVAMGRSFHWMDRADTLRRLDGLVTPGGAIALFSSTAIETPANSWLDEWRDILRGYASRDPSHAARKSAGWPSHESFLLASPFRELETISVLGQVALSADQLVSRAFSMSSTAPARLGEDAPRLEEELRSFHARRSRDGALVEMLAFTATIARRAAF